MVLEIINFKVLRPKDLIIEVLGDIQASKLDQQRMDPRPQQENLRIRVVDSKLIPTVEPMHCLYLVTLGPDLDAQWT